MTQIFFIRHGIAVDRHPDRPDASRPLTEKGRQRTRAVADRLRELGLYFERVSSSPLLRARQTAEILVEAGSSEGFDIAECLAPEGTLEAWLGSRSPHFPGMTALVGHEPNLSAWAERLVWGTASGRLKLKKAGVIGVELPPGDARPGCGRLFWLSAPKLLLGR